MKWERHGRIECSKSDQERSRAHDEERSSKDRSSEHSSTPCACDWSSEELIIGKGSIALPSLCPRISKKEPACTYWKKPSCPLSVVESRQRRFCLPMTPLWLLPDTAADCHPVPETTTTRSPPSASTNCRCTIINHNTTRTRIERIDASDLLQSSLITRSTQKSHWTHWSVDTDGGLSSRERKVDCEACNPRRVIVTLYLQVQIEV